MTARVWRSSVRDILCRRLRFGTSGLRQSSSVPVPEVPAPKFPSFPKKALQTPFRGNLQPMLGPEKTTASTDRPGLGGTSSFKSMNFVQSILEEDEQTSQKNKIDFVHILLNKKKTFVAVTDARGNKKTGASAGSLEGSKGRSRLSRYAAEATAEHVGRSARKIGSKSVVIKVKGSTYFRRKKKVILSWKEGFRGEGVGVKSRILSIYDVTQLPHNGCRLPKKRRV